MSSKEGDISRAFTCGNQLMEVVSEKGRAMRYTQRQDEGESSHSGRRKIPVKAAAYKGEGWEVAYPGHR